MEVLKLRFWTNLALVLVTSYVFIWYVFAPSNNQCQMTFMMEPPKFVRVPIDDNYKDSELIIPRAKLKGPSQDDYKLYMYSELGYPDSVNIKRDLKDSMPVLFVPGNAGSYQQVRSIASTCIRHQLQSLDAHKFVFYTIDFKGQLSGLSGELIEDQTKFVHKSVLQISAIHPVGLDGIILIGHSVGGFISKVLFTIPEFNPSSVALLISLAGPLIEPYLFFDDKMRILYERTNKFWSKKESKLNNTLTISISGGETDRLVPTHLSIDPNFDLSISTSSIKHVWLETDHVCITWCRELMHKLAHLLSALTDKKRNQVITDREVAFPIIREELLVSQEDLAQYDPTVIRKDWKTMKPHILIDFEDSISLSRSQLSSNIVILNLKELHQREELLIVIYHIGSLKTTGLFGCEDLEINPKNNQVTCSKRTNLMFLAKPLPTRRFEPKKTMFRFGENHSLTLRWILLDFQIHTASSSSDNYDYKVPELVTLRHSNSIEEKVLHTPTLTEFIINRYLFSQSYVYPISSSKIAPVLIYKYKLNNLKHNTQLFNTIFRTTDCGDDDEPSDTIISLRNGPLTQSFIPSYNDLEKHEISMKLSPYPTVNRKLEMNSLNETFLEIFVGRTCAISIRIELDAMGVVIDIIQRNLGKILAGATYFAHKSLVYDSFKLNARKVGIQHYLIQESLSILGFAIVYFSPANLSTKTVNSSIETDELTTFLLICISSNGIVAYLNYFIRRLIDIATIINKAQSFIRRRCSKVREVPLVYNLGTLRYLKNEIAWLLIMIAITGSLMFSAAIMSLFKLFSVIKLKLFLDSTLAGLTQIQSLNKHLEKKQTNELNQVLNLLTSIAAFCSLALIANIPKALTRINSEKFISLSSMIESAYKEVYFIASVVSLILVKSVCDRLESLHKTKLDSKVDKKVSYESTLKYQDMSTKSVNKFFRYSHLLSLLPIFLIESNICNIVLALTVTLAWLYCYLLKSFETTS